MQLFYKRFSVITGFFVLLVLLLVNGIVIRRQLGVQVANQAWMSRTQQVLLELTETESLLKDAETGQRGYLYTGNLRYLAPYNAAIGEVASHIRKLQDLVADSPDELTNATRMGGLAKQKLNE